MSKAVIQPFEEYQRGRIMFVQTVAELANKQKHIDSLKSVGVMKLLGPLLSDPVVSIKQSAALAIGRLAKNSKELARAVVDDNGKIIKQLLETFDGDNKFYKKATCFVISSVSRQSEELARKITQFPAIKYLVSCLEEYDPSVKEAAVWALGYIAKHSDQLAKLVTNEPNAIDYLILCLQEPELRIKRITVQTLSHIAQHSPERTDNINSKDNLNFIMFYLKEKDNKLRYKICTCLGNMSKNSHIVAQKIVSDLQSNIIFECIKSSDLNLQKSAIKLLNRIAIRDSELAVTVNSKIDAKEIVAYFKKSIGIARQFTLPLISTITSQGKDMSEAYLNADVLSPINDCLVNISYNIENYDKKEKEKNQGEEKEIEKEDEIVLKSLTCKAIASISNHNSETANKVSEYGDILYKLLCIYCYTDYSPRLKDLKSNSKQGLESITKYCEYLIQLETLLNEPVPPDFLSKLQMKGDFKMQFDKNAYEEILIQTIRRQQDILTDKSERKDYLKRDTLKKILRLQKAYPSISQEIPTFHSIFSPDIVHYYDEEYAKKIRNNYINSATS